MRDRVFGWSYPAGAENDHMAPYNQDFDDTEEPTLADFNHQEELEARYREKRHERYKD